jgi:hypothetical protein
VELREQQVGVDDKQGMCCAVSHALMLLWRICNDGMAVLGCAGRAHLVQGHLLCIDQQRSCCPACAVDP